jgi:class 3 adenylate cyclase/predicted ATPase
VDVGAWLRGLRLERYEQAFRDNDVDADVLPEITENDLIRLGINSVGHRRRLLAALAALRLSSLPGAAIAAERRLLTVLFSDLVGSTDLSSALDPEEMRDVIAGYQRAVVAEIERLGGHVAKFLGDGILAYFGWPQAQEDATERAVLAGLGAARAVARLRAPTGEPLATRIGISAGLVVVGDLLGEGAAREEAIVGETPNLAARLQAAAQPGEVVISEAARRLIGGLFDLAEFGPLALKGFRTPVPAYAVRGEARVASRFDAARGNRLMPLVGREAQLDRLRRGWAAACHGQGGAVLVIGEAGIGKSRLARALVEEVSATRHVVLRCFCSPHHTGTALFPVIEQLRRAARLSGDEPPARQLDNLEALLGHAVAEPGALVPLFASLLDLPTGAGYQLPQLGPAALKARTLEALQAQLVGLARRGPVLALFEDLHWVDPTTAELLALLVARVPDLPVLLLATARPGFAPPWPGVEVLELPRLDQRQSSSMLRELVGGKSLPEALGRDILAKTDGVPLFLEELTKHLLETGWLADAGTAYELARPLPALDVPDTLQGSLMARLDRLSGPKNVAQIGAVIGREFPYALIAPVADLPPADLARALADLEQAGLIHRRGEPPDSVYAFKHALVRDAAYESLLRSRRQILHGRIVAAIESAGDNRTLGQLELLAHHCAGAGLTEKAVTYWRRAGEQAVLRAANREASEHFRKALAQLNRLPEGSDRARTELAILSQLGPALMSLHGWPAREVGEVFERADTVARGLELSADLAPPLIGMWLFHLARGQLDQAEGISGELFRIARGLEDPDLLLQAHHAAWPTVYLRGRLAAAADHIHAGMALYDERRHERHRYLYLGHDPAVCGLAIGAVVQSVRGLGDDALAMERRALDLARRLGHAPSLAHGLWFVGEARVTRGDAAGAERIADELWALCEEHRLPQPRATALMFKGWALARSGEAAAGVARLRQGLTVWDTLGARSYLPRALCLLAECLLLAGDHGGASDTLDRGQAVVAETGETWCAPRLDILRAELIRRTSGDDAEMEAALAAALGRARSQGARFWELCAAIPLARLWLQQADRSRARELLAPIRASFAPGFPSPCVGEADDLLATLR